MKKIKILTSLVGLTGLSMGLIPTIASCGCSTGLQLELVSKKQDREFNQQTNGCKYTFKFNDVSQVKNIKVKISNLKIDDAETQPVSGLLIFTYDSAGNIQVYIDTNILVRQWPNATNISFDLLFTNKITGQTKTFSGFKLIYNPIIPVPCFETIDWSEIFTKLTLYYNGSLTAEEFAKSFGDEDGIAFDNIDQYVGLERNVTINGNYHKVRIIGVKHDTIAEGEAHAGEEALFTFELFTILSNGSGAITTTWDISGTNYDYTNSTLRWNLNNTGTQPSSGAWDTSAFNMLPIDLQNNIKSVTKSVAINESKTGGESYYSVKTYNDKLFPLTYTEMAQSGGTAKVEGTPYAYWSTHNSNDQRVKLDNTDAEVSYWLSSPSYWNTINAWYVYNGYHGGIDTRDTNTTIVAVAPAFCI